MNEDTPRPAYRVQTERLELRCWSPADAPALRAALDESDAHLRPWIPFMAEEPRSLAETASWLALLRARFDLGEGYRYAVFSRDEPGRLLGENMLLARVGPGALEIGYWTRLGQDGRGYAREASRAMIRLAFELHGVSRVEIHCVPENRASAVIPARLGFTHEATRRRFVTDTEGRVRDLMIWTLLDDEYPAAPAHGIDLEAWDAIGEKLL